ncbi:AzlD domain-containing protein [Undibacterium sp.]|jgi:branched-subunit amino acid transport protein|uniref:AzlD domain-containing protein n=1 Tax=Undibacterium sp. TaxID=1914977 RepID=UPI002C42B4BD|nr:AzlD domain-containing protein [Undibacterium sp.]HTD02735.1 AzlD domain-containing protein [Undibacterium sp.]
MNYTLMIFGMAAVTVFVKAIMFILGDRVAFPPLLNLALSFVPVTVLTAIIVPMILAPHGKGMELNWHNPQLIASVVAIIVCAFTRKQMLTIVAGLVVFFAWQLWITA